jgi:hypothetical protein
VRFLVGFVFGLVATGANFAIMFAATRWLVGQQTGAVRFLVPFTHVIRYAMFGALIYVALRFHLGSVWGLLAGVTAGIAVSMTWQVVNNARNRRSS